MARVSKQNSPPAALGAAETGGAPTYLRVLFAPPSNVVTPIEEAGKWWHHGTYHVLPQAVARELAALPHFSVIGPAVPPTAKTP